MASIIQVLLLALCTSMAAGGQCPLLEIKKAEDCFGLTSECWSPGEPDLDCPNNGICCFDGCINACGIPSDPLPDGGPSCTTEYVTQTEDVPEEMCVEIPGMETCTTVNTNDCFQECRWVDTPVNVTETSTCCENVKTLRCEDLTCNPATGTDEVVPYEETVCKKREKVCFNVPEEVCQDQEVQDCKEVESKECKTVKKPTEWPTTTQECVTRYRETCSIINREVCNLNPKLHHLLFKKYKKLHKKLPRQFRQSSCRTFPQKVCKKEPYTDCKEVNAVTIEYVDVEECKPIKDTVCVNKNVSKCGYVDREHCNEAEDVCETNKSTKTIFVRKNCDYVDKTCQFVDVPECEESSRQVEKMVPELVCENVCYPVVKDDCREDEPTQDCRTVFKTMSYKVPVLKC